MPKFQMLKTKIFLKKVYNTQGAIQDLSLKKKVAHISLIS